MMRNPVQYVILPANITIFFWVITEINRPEPPTTPIPTLGTTDAPTGDNSNNGGIGESTTPDDANPTRVSISYDII